MFLPSFIYHESTLTWVIGFAVLLLILVFSRQLSLLLLRIVLARLNARKRERYLLVRQSLRRPVAWMITAGGAGIISGFMPVPAELVVFVNNFLASLFMLSAIWTLYAAAGLVAAALIAASHERKSPVNPTGANFIGSGVQIAVVVIGLLLVLSRWIPDISGLIAGLGIGGLALALAAQDTASNLIGSIAIMMDKPFEIGDWIEVDGHSGTVERIGMRSSRVRALDQTIISIPNSHLASSIIINGAHRASRRVAYRIALAPDTPFGKLTELGERIRQILAVDPDIDKNSILVTFDTFTPYSMDISVIYHTAADFRQMMIVRERNNLAVLSELQSLNIRSAAPPVSAPPEPLGQMTPY